MIDAINVIDVAGSRETLYAIIDGKMQVIISRPFSGESKNGGFLSHEYLMVKELFPSNFIQLELYVRIVGSYQAQEMIENSMEANGG